MKQDKPDYEPPFLAEYGSLEEITASNTSPINTPDGVAASYVS